MGENEDVLQGGANLITGNDGSRQPVATMSRSVLGIRPLVLVTENCLSERSRGSPEFSGSFYRIEDDPIVGSDSISSIPLILTRLHIVCDWRIVLREQKPVIFGKCHFDII